MTGTLHFFFYRQSRIVKKKVNHLFSWAAARSSFFYATFTVIAEAQLTAASHKNDKRYNETDARYRILDFGNGSHLNWQIPQEKI